MQIENAQQRTVVAEKFKLLRFTNLDLLRQENCWATDHVIRDPLRKEHS